MLTVCGEVPLRRYNGLDKAFGPQYVRGIEASDTITTKLFLRQGDRRRRIVISPKIEDDGLHNALYALRQLPHERLLPPGAALG